jgi:PiT family inorganic phosphate transporter
VHLAGVIIVIFVAMFFAYTNGFHDAANAIATSVSTRALTMRSALLMAAVFNLAGSFLGAKVAKTITDGIIQPAGHGLTIVFAAVVGAIAWNLLTWGLGLPSSSSHALIGGMVGAALASQSTVLWWSGVVKKFLIPTLLSPIVGVILGYLVMLALLWLFRRANPGKVTRGFRRAQTVSAAAMAFGHGLQDTAKTMGIVVLALVTGGVQSSNHIPLWVFFASAAVMALGTYSGGARIIRTLGRRIIELDPPHGFAAETTASSVLYVAGVVLGAPISTTHTITSAIMGVGATKRLSAVRWGMAGNIAAAWLFTLPGAGLVAAAVLAILRPFVF